MYAQRGLLQEKLTPGRVLAFPCRVQPQATMQTHTMLSTDRTKESLRMSTSTFPLNPPEAKFEICLSCRTKARMVDDALAVARKRDEQALLQKYGSSLIQGGSVSLCC